MGAAGPQTQTYDLRDASNRGLRRMVTIKEPHKPLRTNAQICRDAK